MEALIILYLGVQMYRMMQKKMNNHHDEDDLFSPPAPFFVQPSSPKISRQLVLVEGVSKGGKTTPTDDVLHKLK